ncbi:MAG: glycosyltransferase [Muribaculaceae bacterium]|nr:glycosyltransferase [Muribaculaceae bacterium]
MAEMERLSIITITRNDGAALAEAVRSVASQTAASRIEHLVVDSSEPPARLPDGSEARLLRVAPRGVYAALNEGVRRSTGEIIGMVHGNDRLPGADTAARVLELFDADPELDFIYGNLEYRDPASGELRRRYDSSRFRPRLLDYGFGPAHPTLYVRRRVFERAGGLYDESFRIAGDFEMWIRLFSAEAGLKWRHVDEVLSIMSPGGLSSRLGNQLTVSIREKLKALRKNGHKASVAKLFLRAFYL